MGTRGAIGFRIDDQDKVAYNHFDSYPSALGVTALGFVRTFDPDSLAEKARALRLINTETDKPTTEDVKACEAAGFADYGVSTGKPDDWYCLLRGAQGELASYLEVGVIPDASDFLIDSLFCEWAYIINLDTDKLEVYRGFNKAAGGAGRYASKLEEGKEWRDPEYYGVALIAEVPLTFIRDLQPEGVEAVALEWEEQDSDE